MSDRARDVALGVVSTLLVIIALGWWRDNSAQLKQPYQASADTVTMMNRSQFDDLVAKQFRLGTPVVVLQQSAQPIVQGTPVAQQPSSQTNQASEVVVRSVATVQVPPTATPATVYSAPIGGRQLPTTITIQPNTKLSDVPLSWIADPIDLYVEMRSGMDQKVKAQIKSGQKVNYLSAKWSLFKVDDILDVLEKSMPPRARGAVLESTLLFFWLEEAAHGTAAEYISYNEMMHRINRIDRLLDQNDITSQYKLAAARAIVNSPR